MYALIKMIMVGGNFPWGIIVLLKTGGILSREICQGESVRGESVQGETVRSPIHTYIRTYIHMRTYIHTYIIGGSTGASQIIEKRPCFHFTLLYLYFHLTCYFYLLLRHFPPQCFRQVYTTVHACVVSLF